MSCGSLVFIRTVNVVYTGSDVVGNTSPMLAFLRGIGVGWLAYGLGMDISWVKVTQIWTVRRPIEWVNAMIGEKILTNSGYMVPGVILLEN
jgi:hypothetical protein